LGGWRTYTPLVQGWQDTEVVLVRGLPTIDKSFLLGNKAEANKLVGIFDDRFTIEAGDVCNCLIGRVTPACVAVLMHFEGDVDSQSCWCHFMQVIFNDLRVNPNMGFAVVHFFPFGHARPCVVLF